MFEPYSALFQSIFQIGQRRRFYKLVERLFDAQGFAFVTIEGIVAGQPYGGGRQEHKQRHMVRGGDAHLASEPCHLFHLQSISQFRAVDETVTAVRKAVSHQRQRSQCIVDIEIERGECIDQSQRFVRVSGIKRFEIADDRIEVGFVGGVVGSVEVADEMFFPFLGYT